MKKLACITLDMEPDYGNPEKRIRLLENSEYFERYVSIINKYNVKVTMFTVTNLFEKFGDVFSNLATRIPLEYSVHSHTHDPHNACSLDEVQNSKQAYTNFTGKIPIGYRAPIGRIDKAGLGHLLDNEFMYDASVYPSVRPGEFGYSNLHMPNIPFRVKRADGKSLIEFPFTAIEKIRIIFALSYAKLFGWGIYSLLLKTFGLPNHVLLLSHPHDFYFASIPNSTVTGAEKFALSRNSAKAFDYFEKMIQFLVKQKYEFVFVSELAKEVKYYRIQEIAWEHWK
ncbi:MAG: polysaccharide deacetylase family protein [Anaerolineales bacterium]|nr:polysaccharide deacetylase family protein [Anaerolineales bacterium]